MKQLGGTFGEAFVSLHHAAGCPVLRAQRDRTENGHCPDACPRKEDRGASLRWREALHPRHAVRGVLSGQCDRTEEDGERNQSSRLHNESPFKLSQHMAYPFDAGRQKQRTPAATAEQGPSMAIGGEDASGVNERSMFKGL